MHESPPLVGETKIKTELSVSATCLCLLALLFLGWGQNPMIIGLDRGFFSLSDAVTRESWALDTLIVNIFRTNTAKIVPMLACIVWLVFERRQQGQSIAFLGPLLLGALMAMTASRLVQNLSAYRPRPLHDPELGYELPFGIETTHLPGWSSFPSDTSALGFAIAAGIFIASRRLGAAAFLWALVVVAFPRAYAGLHYPSDLVGGALIGIVCTSGIAPLFLRAAARPGVPNIPRKWVPFLWTFGFLFMFQMGSMFDDVRTYGSFAMDVILR